MEKEEKSAQNGEKSESYLHTFHFCVKIGRAKITERNEDKILRIRKKKWARPELAACPFYVHEPKTAAGTWGERFKKQQPIHLDLGCGKCTFLAKLAHREKDVNFIGIDISEDILGVARRNIEAEFGEEPVENVNLLSYNIEKLDTLFAPDEKAARIYVNFCNPWQKAGDHKRRLTHTRQLNTYKKVLAPGGELWFKTNNTDLYLATQRYLAEASFEILCKTDDLHSEDAPGNIQSEHEVMFTAEGIKTKAIIARWNGEPETPERVSTEQAEKVENTAE